MKRSCLTRIVWLWLIILSAPVARAFDDEEFLLRVGREHLQSVLRAYRLELEESLPGQSLYLVERDDDDDDESTGQFIARVRRDSRVLGFEIDQEVEAPEVRPGVPLNPSLTQTSQALQNRAIVNFYGSPAWTGFVNQAARETIRATAAHQSMATGAGVVAVIDTGVDPNHPLLRGALVPGYDFIRNEAGGSEWSDIDSTTAANLTQEISAFLEGQPKVVNSHTAAILRQEISAFLEGSPLPAAFGHGTMVAGVIRLVAPTARIMPLKAFSGTGASSLFNLVRAVYYASANGAKVINMSFTLSQPSDEFARAVNQAAAAGVICVASAGNDGRQMITFPAGYSNVLGTASMNGSDQRSSFSNYGSALVKVAAPGENIVTAFPGGGYAAAWGTSFSSPMVAGAAALLLHSHPNTTFVQALQSIQHAHPATTELGAGKLDVVAAILFRRSLP
ncbi:MAG: S8 family serine peptidase [Bryobacteraceae bacterium]|nr:S8 family serine peptidase [Bryobacteraceae bacterium]